MKKLQDVTSLSQLATVSEQQVQLQSIQEHYKTLLVKITDQIKDLEDKTIARYKQDAYLGDDIDS